MDDSEGDGLVHLTAFKFQAIGFEGMHVYTHIINGSNEPGFSGGVLRGSGRSEKELGSGIRRSYNRAYSSTAHHPSMINVICFYSGAVVQMYEI